MKLGELLRVKATAASKPIPAAEGGVEVQWIETAQIRPGRYQPRRTLPESELEELARSIQEHGVLQPILVRRVEGGYELVAGERRWRAAQMAGLTKVPAIVRDADDRTAAEWALIENLQRAELHFLEQAEGFRRVMEEFGLTQEELARRLGCSQGAIANKLRLLRLPEEVRAIIRERGLGERQSRSLLRLEDPAQQLQAVKIIAERQLSAEESERLVEGLLKGPERRRRVRAVYGDARIFVNGLRQVVRQARKAGLEAALEEHEDDTAWTFVVKLAKAKSSGRDRRGRS
ncbi:MAG TPA: ParB/RepB/Spo0J family partition protein [Limnochordales bacterium]|mgnify:CR=1 FL=1